VLRAPVHRRRRWHDRRLVLPIAALRGEVLNVMNNDLEMIRGTRATLSLLSGKWSVDVLYLLASGSRRYSDVLYEVGEISKKTLTHTLRSLERDGLITRRLLPEIPVRVEYTLTPLGWSITGPLMALYEWSAQHLPTDSAYDERLAA
jgi:DNA-binding HxlR family transcriptional regulator